MGNSEEMLSDGVDGPDGPPSYTDSVESSGSSGLLANITRSAPPIQRNSSSSILRAPKQPNKKPSAYKPAKAQQAQIDLLAKSDVTALTAVGSHSQTEYFDILPSFQMFQSILKRDNNQFDENLVVCPPVYGDITTTSPTPPSLSPITSNDAARSTSTIDDMLNQVTSRVEEYNLANDENDSNMRITDEIVHEHNRNIEITENSYGYSPLDKIDKLPTSRTSPLDIQIYVTKKVPIPNTKCDLETRLKEYSSGDLINGYIIITNTSKNPVDFGLFTVSLEGTIKATEPNTHLNLADTHKYNRIIMKKFLKMYDFHASYGYTHVPNSSGIEYVAYSKDLNDGTQLGLPTDRKLAPLAKYKKFFTFKFPDKLLDNSCPDSLLPHILPPPSMGLDSTCFYNMGENIELNKALGYGFLNIRGTPLLTRDYSLENVSISYTIEAKFIDKVDHKNLQQNPITHDHINDPNSDQDYEISKSNQFYLRFIPDLKDQMEYYNQRFNHETYGSIGIDGKLMQQFTSLVTWRSINEQNYNIEKEIDDVLSKQGLSLAELKVKNLFTSNNEVTNNVIRRLNIKDQIHNQLHREYDENFVYQQQRMLGNKLSTKIYGKKKKSFLSSVVNIGHSDLYVKIPDKVISYGSPRLLQRYNDNSNASNSGGSSMDITPVSSNMSELYNRDQDDLLQSLDMDLLFSPNEPGIKPPPIVSIDTNVVVWTYYTDSPIPFEIGYDFLYTNVDEDDKLIDNPVEITRANLQHLKDRAFNYLSFLQANNIEISKKSFLYLSSIKTLGIKKDTIQEYFESYTSPEVNKESNWVFDSSSKDHKWCQKITIPIKPINKNNVNLLPTFQSCLVGRMYCLQVVVKYKGHSEGHDNEVKVDIPILIG